MNRLRVAGTGSFLPSNVLNNKYFTDLSVVNMYGPKDEIIKTYANENKLTEEGIIRTTGIKERRKVSEGQYVEEMAYEASIEAINRSGIRPEELKGIICATLPSDRNIPSIACRIQSMIEKHYNASLDDCRSYDINYACAGFPEAIRHATLENIANNGGYLIVSSEIMTRRIDYHDINANLFGDGAGAAVLVPSNDARGILGSFSKSITKDGKDRYIITSGGKVRMPEGQKVMKSAITEGEKCVIELKNRVGWEKADVYVFHQANKRIIDKIRERVSGDGSIVFENIEKYGNMSAATCAVALDEAIKEKVVKEGSKTIIAGFGAGFVVSGVAIQF